MSTSVATPLNYNQILGGVSAPAVRARPMEAVTARITGVREYINKPDSDYDTLNLQVEVTRGGRLFFAQVMFRPEMVSFGNFSVENDYDNNTKNIAYLSEQKVDKDNVPQLDRAGNPKTNGSSFSWVYGINIMPEVRTKFNKETKTSEVVLGDDKSDYPGHPLFSNLTPLYAATGGTPILFSQFVARVREATEKSGTISSAFGFKVLSATQFHNELVEHIKQNSPMPEQVFILKQRRSQSGALQDNYEVARYFGALTARVDDAVNTWVDKASKSPDPAKWLKKVYAVER